MNNNNGVQTPGAYGNYRSRSPNTVSQITSADGRSVRVNDYSVQENRMFEKPLGSALLRYLPEISAVMYDVFGEGSLNYEERLASRKRRKSIKKENREKRKNRSNNNGEELDGDFGRRKRGEWSQQNRKRGRNGTSRLKIRKKTKTTRKKLKKARAKISEREGASFGRPRGSEMLWRNGCRFRNLGNRDVLNVLPTMFAVGLSKSLVSSLETITDALPDLTSQIQSRLFDAVSMATRTTNG